MPFNSRSIVWLACLTVLMNLLLLPVSQALSMKQRATFLLGGFCGLTQLSSQATHERLSLLQQYVPVGHPPTTDHLCQCSGIVGVPVPCSVSLLSLDTDETRLVVVASRPTPLSATPWLRPVPRASPCHSSILHNDMA